ncbi:hypothetical protein GF345_03785 [Candidatus Woesearchaeota archaeon]|nr:hypothetical protein [Candidatus Woesearchaeota archaeon]
MINTDRCVLEKEIKSRILNKDDIPKPLFAEFIENLSSYSILGIDIDEVLNHIDGRLIRILKLNSQNLKDIKKLTENLKASIVCMNLPKHCNEDHIRAILDLSTINHDEDEDVLWYARFRDESISVLIIYV